MPFRGVTIKEIKEKINPRDNGQPKVVYKDTISEQAKNLLSGMLCRKENRLSIEEIINHEWFADKPE